MFVAHQKHRTSRLCFAGDTPCSSRQAASASRHVAYVYSGVVHTRGVRLIEALGCRRIDFNLEQTDALESTKLEMCDLILLDAIRLPEPEQQYLVEWVRLHTLAPLVVLGKRRYLQDNTLLLARGADTIVWVDEPLEVNVARCRAILRRAQSL